jgi:heme A synthase
MLRRLKRILARVLVVSVALLAFLAWLNNRPNGNVRILQGDVISRYTPSGAKQTHKSWMNGGLFPGSGDGSLVRMFANCDQRCFDDLVRVAQANGWTQLPQSGLFAERQSSSQSVNTSLVRAIGKSDQRHVTLRLFLKDPDTPTETGLYLSTERGEVPKY